MTDFSNILGLHWMIDAEGCTAPLGDVEALKDILIELPDALGLTRVGTPQLFEHCEPTSDKTLAGLILLAESHLSIHLRPEQGILHADLFSCAAFDKGVALKMMKACYGFSRFEETSFERGRGLLTKTQLEAAG